MNRSNLLLLLCSIAVALAFFTCAADDPQEYTVSVDRTQQYAVSVPGINYVVMVRVPSSFRPAATPAEASARESLISAVETNPLGKASVSEVFSTDWTQPMALPILYIGTLPAAERAQGKFTRDYWNEFKDMFKQHAELAAMTLRQQMLTYGLPDPGETMNHTIIAADKNTVVLFAFAPTGKASDAPPILVARKLKYIRKSIVLFEAGVDASRPDAMAKLDQIIRTVDVL